MIHFTGKSFSYVKQFILPFVTTTAGWKQVFVMVQEARIDRHMKLVPFAGQFDFHLSVLRELHNIFFFMISVS